MRRSSRYLVIAVSAAWAGFTLAMPGGARAQMPVKAPLKGACDPYKNYGCLDAYLGEDFWTRLVNYYRLEWGKGSAPSDPKAPPSRRAGWPPAPQATPPHPFTERPHAGPPQITRARPR